MMKTFHAILTHTSKYFFKQKKNPHFMGMRTQPRKMPLLCYVEKGISTRLAMSSVLASGRNRFSVNLKKTRVAVVDRRGLHASNH